MRCLLPWPSEYCHPQAPDTSSSPLFNLHLNPNWVNRPTDQPTIYPRYGKNTTPSPPLLCTNSVSSCTTVSGGSSDTCKAVDVKDERWSRTFATVQPCQRRSLSALDFRFLPLLFRANQGPWNCALWLYSFSFESCRPDTRIGDNNNCSTSKWLCNTSHLRIIRIRILEKWAKYKHHPSFKAGHSFFLFRKVFLYPWHFFTRFCIPHVVYAFTFTLDPSSHRIFGTELKRKFLSAIRPLQLCLKIETVQMLLVGLHRSSCWNHMDRRE